MKEIKDTIIDFLSLLSILSPYPAGILSTNANKNRLQNIISEKSVK